MRICAWPCGQAQTPLLLRPSYDEERRRSRRTEGRPLSLSVQFSTARNVQFSAGVDIANVSQTFVLILPAKFPKPLPTPCGCRFLKYWLAPEFRGPFIG